MNVRKIAVIGGTNPERQSLSERLPSEWTCVEVSGMSVLDDHRDAGLIIDLAFTPDKDRIGQLSRLLPIPILINSVTYTLKEIGQPFIRMNGWPGMLAREIYELAVGQEMEQAGVFPEELFRQLGWKYRIVPDVPGMVSGRILAMIINEAFYTLQENVSTKEEIDTAMRLGTNYPFGPFEWSEKIGLENIYDLLNKLAATDDRYMPARGMIATMANSLGAASVANSD